MAAEQRQCRLAYESCPWLAPYLGAIDHNWKPVSLTHVVYPEGIHFILIFLRL